MMLAGDRKTGSGLSKQALPERLAAFFEQGFSIFLGFQLLVGDAFFNFGHLLLPALSAT